MVRSAASEEESKDVVYTMSNIKTLTLSNIQVMKEIEESNDPSARKKEHLIRIENLLTISLAPPQYPSRFYDAF
jgi:hypothetical protein